MGAWVEVTISEKGRWSAKTNSITASGSQPMAFRVAKSHSKRVYPSGQTAVWMVSFHSQAIRSGKRLSSSISSMRPSMAAGSACTSAISSREGRTPRRSSDSRASQATSSRSGPEASTAVSSSDAGAGSSGALLQLSIRMKSEPIETNTTIKDTLKPDAGEIDGHRDRA